MKEVKLKKVPVTSGIMNFREAYQELLADKKIRRREWEHFMHMRLVSNEVLTFKGEYSNFDSDATIIVSDGWVVAGTDHQRKGMKFIDALDELKARKSITNLKWIDQKLEQFIFIDDSKIVICKEVEFDFMPTYQCLCSNDWEIMI